MTDVTLRWTDAVKKYGHEFTLGPLNVTIGGGVTCLVGPNGAGKSTMFRLAAGVDSCSQGSVAIDAGDGPTPPIGYLPQSPALPRPATCAQFLRYAAWLQRVPRGNRDAAVSSALEVVGLRDRHAARIRSLSGGMARRLGIAHALVHRPGVLLLDEPTVGLDPRQRLALRETISTLGRDRVVLVSTHLVEDVRGLADRVLVLDGGQLVFDGHVADLERRADPAAPGDTDLERALATLLGADE